MIGPAVREVVEHGRCWCDDWAVANAVAADLEARGVPCRVTETWGSVGRWTVTASAVALDSFRSRVERGASGRPVLGEVETMTVGLDDYAADTRHGQHSMLPRLDGQGELGLDDDGA